MLKELKRETWKPPENHDGKTHDNPHHAGMRSHLKRKEGADDSLREAIQEGAKIPNWTMPKRRGTI
jgi:hypothetical protein